MNTTKSNWKKYALEFFSIFIAVFSAFALNNWNENRRDNRAAVKILTEISNGLNKDIDDININIYGHEEGIKSCKYWRNIITNQPVNLHSDSLKVNYFGLTRDFFSAQNSSGYETLKSRGLELIENDSLRFKIISLYEYNYTALTTLEEEYYEMQFQENYYKDINGFVAENLEFDNKGNISNLRLPLQLTTKEKNTFMAYLWKIQVNRQFILSYYKQVKKKVEQLVKQIDKEIK